jgi:muramidase (phage lysozyme)
LLEADGGLIEPAQRDGLALAIQDERTRREARDRVAALAHGMDDVAGDLDGLLARAGEAAGDDPARADAYRAAALGLWHGARQARDAAEDAAWIGVLPHLTGGAVTAWTDLPADVWRALSPRQQAAVRERTENPYGESDPEVLAGLKDMVAKDPAAFKAMDLGALYGTLTPEDAAEWRALQEGARAMTPEWATKRAHLSTASSTIDSAVAKVASGFERDALRARLYESIWDAETIAGGDLTRQQLIELCADPTWWEGLARKIWPDDKQGGERALPPPPGRVEEPMGARDDRLLEQERLSARSGMTKQQRLQADRRDFALSTWRGDPRVQAFLDMISKAEGSDYNSLSGDLPDQPTKWEFRSFDTHPGWGALSTASGRYQITEPTWRDFGQRLGLKDFSPDTQNLIATQILIDAGVLADLRNNNFPGAMDRASRRWASLAFAPGKPGRYGQPSKPFEWSEAEYLSNLRSRTQQ